MRWAPQAARQIVRIVGCANGNAGRQLGCESAATVMRQSSLLAASGVPHRWHGIIEPVDTGRRMNALPGVVQMSERLCAVTSATVNGNDEQLLVIGGDHSCAIGTWSGVASALRQFGHLGLIWVDAHMDAHTPASSDTGNLHGMPIAHLLGVGHRCLTTVGDALPKLLPSNLVMLGIRSYEPAEQELLERMKVRIFYMNEVERRGIDDVMGEAIEIVNWQTSGWGLSIDLDAFRVEDAPAVGTPERGGLVAADFQRSLQSSNLRQLVATEIVEFLPAFDSEDRRSERLVVGLIETIYNAKHRQVFESKPSTEKKERMLSA